MKKTYLEPEIKLYAMRVEGHLLDNTITGSTTDPEEGGDPTHKNRSVKDNSFKTSAKTEIEWDS